jgi:hypothetical protein
MGCCPSLLLANKPRLPQLSGHITNPPVGERPCYGLHKLLGLNRILHLFINLP